MKNLLNNAIACAIVTSMLFSCSHESIEAEQSEAYIPKTPSAQADCLDQDPQAGITNNGTISINLQIASIDGTILHNIENIAAGSTSGFLTFAPNEVIFNISKNTTGIQDDKVVFVMGQCMSFNMVLGADNYLVAGTPENL
tara:strand:+ start:400 stop:822 length:423 start_codon:yes stop_codon:yes gene_type:complete